MKLEYKHCYLMPEYGYVSVGRVSRNGLIALIHTMEDEVFTVVMKNLEDVIEIPKAEFQKRKAQQRQYQKQKVKLSRLMSD